MENREKWIEVLSTWISVLYHRYWDSIQEGISVIIARCFFQYNIISRQKDRKNSVLLLLKNKFEWNLNDLPKDFSSCLNMPMVNGVTCEQNLLKTSIWTYTITTLRVSNFCEGVHFSGWLWLKRCHSHSKLCAVHLSFCSLIRAYLIRLILSCGIIFFKLLNYHC